MFYNAPSSMLVNVRVHKQEKDTGAHLHRHEMGFC